MKSSSVLGHNITSDTSASDEDLSTPNQKQHQEKELCTDDDDDDDDDDKSSQTCQSNSNISTSKNDDNSMMNSNDDIASKYRIVLAGRRGNRFISNLEEVITTIEKVFRDHTVDIIYFGDLSPCEQIAVAQSTSLFIFVHGAEGRMISFMKPGTIAVELWPGCQTSNDFYMMYKFFYPAVSDAARVRHTYFSATYPSTTICQAWEYRMRIAHGCGFTIVTDLFKKFLKKLYLLEQNKM
jgi:hypothetical protein